jgi:hypothetical protein
MPACSAIANAIAIVRHQLNRLRSRADVRAIVKLNQSLTCWAPLRAPIVVRCGSATKAAEKCETLHQQGAFA